MAIVAGLAYGLPRYALLQMHDPEQMALAEAAARRVVDQDFPHLSNAERTTQVGTLGGRGYYFVDFIDKRGDDRVAVRIIVDRSTFEAEAFEYVKISGSE